MAPSENCFLLSVMHLDIAGTGDNADVGGA